MCSRGAATAASRMTAAPWYRTRSRALCALGPPYHTAIVEPVVTALDEAIIVAPATTGAFLFGVHRRLTDVVSGGGHHRRHLGGLRCCVHLPKT